MPVTDGQVVKKQCNIGKYEAYSGKKILTITKRNCDKSTGSTLRQTNISHHPLFHCSVSIKQYSNLPFYTIQKKQSQQCDLETFQNLQNQHCIKRHVSKNDVLNSGTSDIRNNTSHYRKIDQQTDNFFVDKHTPNQINKVYFDNFSQPSLMSKIKKDAQLSHNFNETAFKTSSPIKKSKKLNNFCDLDFLPLKLETSFPSFNTSDSSKLSVAKDDSRSIFCVSR